jgi:hypothetical protein
MHALAEGWVKDDDPTMITLTKLGREQSVEAFAAAELSSPRDSSPH